MPSEPQATVVGPARRRETWSLKTLVEDISGRPIGEFQEPGRPVHPYLKAKMAFQTAGPVRASAPPTESAALRPLAASASGVEEAMDPVERVYPPLAGATGRRLHGPDAEHHHATLAEFARPAEPPMPGTRPHLPGPSRRPERIYLHYLLLHLDRLSDSALRYLEHAVGDELVHRRGPSAEPPIQNGP